MTKHTLTYKANGNAAIIAPVEWLVGWRQDYMEHI